MARRGGLGTGLDALIPTSLTVGDQEVGQQNEVAISAISPNPRQPRTHFDPAALNELIDIPIPRTVRVSEAPGFKQTVMTYDPVSPGAVAYMSVARELAERGKPFDSNVVSINYKREGEIA